ncbi:MAG: hypothetical protein NVS3B26_21090 [Mycobacteriales bacterium]
MKEHFDGTRRGPGAGGGRPAADPPAADGIGSWFAGRLPDDWFAAPPEIAVDRDEILVVGQLALPAEPGESPESAAAGRINRFREETRETRMQIAREAEGRFGRKVAWGAVAGQTRQVFTSLSVPVMTRLRQPERQVLDVLVDSGVARSRSDALAWCVKLVGSNTASWLAELQTAMESVQQVRDRGPAA